MSTGPTGPNELSGIDFVRQNQPGWEPMPPPMYPDTATLALFPNSATGPVEPPHIATLDELMASHAVVVQKETADRTYLNPFINPTREQYRPQLFQWAAAGFPGIYVVQALSVTPPDICSDGVVRDANAYIRYLMGFDMGTVVANIQSLMAGIVVSYSFDANIAKIHVTKP